MLDTCLCLDIKHTLGKIKNNTEKIRLFCNFLHYHCQVSSIFHQYCIALSEDVRSWPYLPAVCKIPCWSYMQTTVKIWCLLNIFEMCNVWWVAVGDFNANTRPVDMSLLAAAAQYNLTGNINISNFVSRRSAIRRRVKLMLH